MKAFDSLFIALVQSQTPNDRNRAGQCFYDHYEKKIKAYALKSKVSPPNEADVIVAEAYLDLEHAIKADALQTDFDSHIWGKVRKLVSESLRNHKKDTKQVNYPGDLPHSEPYFLHDETRSSSLDLWDERYKEIIESLSPKNKELIQLYLRDTTNRREIADKLGEKEGTIRKRWHFLKDKLRKLLE